MSALAVDAALAVDVVLMAARGDYDVARSSVADSNGEHKS
jgi:hypothetical protein